MKWSMLRSTRDHSFLKKILKINFLNAVSVAVMSVLKIYLIIIFEYFCVFLLEHFDVF